MFESLLLLLPLSPLPRLDASRVVESLRPLLLDSPEPRRRSELGTITVVDSRLDQSFSTSERKSDTAVVCESLLDFELELLMPESALDSLRFLIDASMLGVFVVWSVVDCLPQGRLLAKSARVSRR